MTTKKKSSLPAELENVATLENVNQLEQRLDKCYSSEKYEDFQTSVEKIIERYLNTDGAHDKLKAKITRQIKDYFDERGYKNKIFWVPTTISAVAAIAAIIALFTKSN